MKSAFSCFVLIACMSATAAPDPSSRSGDAAGRAHADKRLPAKPIDGADSFLEIAYVPANHLTGDATWDHLMALDLFVPKDEKERHPVVLIVHGGGYGGGDKDRFQPEFTAALVKRGYAVANLNYILTPAQIFPQVFWDFRTAVRFLRASARKYRLDPARIGAVGFSAGGWLISSASFTGPEELAISGSNAVAVAEVRASGWTLAKSRFPVLLPMDDPDPPYAEQSAKVNAISFDLSHGEDRLSADDPAINVWGGSGFEPKWAAAARAAGLRYSLCELTGEKFKGNSVHVPPMNSPAASADGKGQVTLAERIIQFLDCELITDPRAVAPEVRPNRRIFVGKLTVSLVVPVGAVAHYTIDGSEPTPQSVAYTRPFEVDANVVTVKAITTADGQRPSGVASATFWRDPAGLPPTIVAPAAAELPVAKVGQPYRVTFKAEGAGDKPMWVLAGRVAPFKPLNKPDTVYPLGMKLDRDTGELSGTPDAPGRYWVQVQVARGERRLGCARNYLLVVEP